MIRSLFAIIYIVFILLMSNVSFAQAPYSVIGSPSSATVNDNLVITFADVDPVNDFYTDNQDPIYIYAGVETDAGTWQFINGDINDINTLGSAAAISSDSFSITIDPASFFNIPVGTNVKGINIIFINQYGPGGNNQTSDLYIDLVDALVSGPSSVVVTPTLPTSTEGIVVDFDATGTSLAGASKIYIHAGASVKANNTSSFDFVTGNWGLDDGVGEMTNISGDMWQISFPSMYTYFNIPLSDNVFGLNFLFRNEGGTLIEDQSGSNYHNDINPGPYFLIDSPNPTNHYGVISSNVTSMFTASISPTTWTLEEVDINDNFIANIGSQSGSISYAESILINSTDTKKYKISADFSGTVKYKYFTVTGFNPIVELDRPSWTSPGVNYHPSDATKVTLVLHAPTYTRYLSGLGTVTGTNNTQAKNVVYVVGDFNNWETSETYKMYRDRDGWDGTSDADNDNDRGDYWWIELSGLVPGQEYVFQYAIDGVLQVADPYTNQVSDSEDQYITGDRYPNLISYPSQAQDRASVLQTDQSVYNWTAPSFTKPSENKLNIYELHFRDFTEEGTYLAAIDRLDYIKALGINAIHVMPVSEFEGNNSWGYNPNFYFAADKYYGTDDDLKLFIDECHHREIQVFNDLVLNHAFYSNVMARMYWNQTDNQPANDNPWFNPEHKMVANEAGWWGADWNHESEHTQVMVDRALDFWLQEFKFDGFRFDFTKGFGQTAQDPSDDWASSYDQNRIDLLLRMVNGMKSRNPGSVAIFEHLAWASEDAVLADNGILMWSGAGHHGKMKEFMLGWNGEDIYSSGIYTAQGFSFANWMSYMESHDEERQAYEVLQYGNNINSTEKLIDRLKIGAAYNLLFPGPRMLWQFEELAYDVSINFNGRTGEKPVHWEYYYDQHRHELWRLMSQLLYLRNNYDLYATTPDYGNIGSTDPVTVPRVMSLLDGTGNQVIVIANLDPSNTHIVTPGYDFTGTWFRYNGDPLVDDTFYSVNALTDTYSLQPSEVLVLTNFDSPWTDDCDLADACCVRSVFTWLGGNGDWNVKANWDLNAIPKPCDMVIIPAGNTVTIQENMTGYGKHVLTLPGATLNVLGDLHIDESK